MSPQRIQMSRQHPWRVDHRDAVIVARPSKWGNDWRVTSWQPERGVTRWSVWSTQNGETYSQHATRESAIADAIERFRADIAHRAPDLTPIRGRDLACWCPLDQPCHADVLLELANVPTTTDARVRAAGGER